MSNMPQTDNLHEQDRNSRAANYPMDTTLYTEKLIQQANQFGLPWMRVGALIRDDRNRFLLVHEAKVERPLPNGSTEWVAGDGGWNIPAGRVNIGENMRNAAIREAREESGYAVNLSGICQITQRTTPHNPYTLVTFIAEATEFFDDFDREEVSEIGWFTFKEIEDLHDRGQLRSPDLVLGAIKKSRRLFPADLGLIRSRSE